jgi:hypothetical protein
MKKLEEIPKNNLFTVPEGYFEKLPGRIQSRIVTGSSSENSFFFAYKLQYILPAVLVVASAVTFWLSGLPTENNSENLLASVETSDLIAYLNDSELTTEDVIENVSFDQEDLNEIEDEVYDENLNGVDLKTVDELDLENI